MHYETQKLGTHRGALRFYKQGARLANAGFTPGTRFSVQKEKGMVAITIDPKGTNGVSQKGDGIPVIDINNRDTLAIFEGMDQIRVIVQGGKIYLLALASEVRRRERLDRVAGKLASDTPLLIGSISHGAGILSHAIHHGIESQRVDAQLHFANDIDPGYLEQASEHNDAWDTHTDTISVAAPMQEFATDEWMMRQIGHVDILEGGIPCTAASLAGRAKKGLEKPEDDPHVGHLMHTYLTLVGRLNPAVCVLENVPAYQNTASMGMFRSQMNDLGYEVHERILEAKDFGALENRKRMVAVAVTKGMKFDFNSLDGEGGPWVVRRVSDILEPIAEDDPMWSPMQYLKDKEVRDAEKGNSFSRQEVHASDTSVPTVTRGYMKRRSTDPMLVHPTNHDLLRLFTPREHARIKGVPEQLIEGMSATRAHEVLGQGVCYAPFFAVGKAIGKLLAGFNNVDLCITLKNKEEHFQLAAA